MKAITLPGADKGVTIYNPQGKVIHQGSNQTINTSPLPQGTYHYITTEGKYHQLMAMGLRLLKLEQQLQGNHIGLNVINLT